MGASAASVDSTGGGGGGESSEHQLATDLLLHASRSGDPLGGRYVAGKLEHGRQVVVKVFKDVKGNELKAFKQRVETLCGLDLHLHLLLPIGWGIWESCCFVVYDMLDQTDAEKRLLVSRRGGRPFLWADRLRLAAAVASIARSVVHRASRPAARRSCLLGSPHLNLKLSSVVFDRSWKSIPVQMG
ncbi:Putative LRR receptor-like serine/threonine-protein kinase [Durusdinium trenchii]|uniref:LRR receptor-like serine/threonine-protein kinase n=1 Tax=Durusdinium trenchii TaxID=1381693 RepID=A0ABP0S771_9DINO